MKQFTVHGSRRLGSRRLSECSVFLTAGFCLLASVAFAQTNLALSGSASTNTPLVRLPAPTDFQRLQYYYAAQPNSPAPGNEHGIFTLKPDRTWSGDWNSKIVPKPTRQQLSAITPQQVDLFRRAAVFANGAWQIATSRTNVPLATLSVTASDYSALRVVIERDKALQKYQQLEQAVQALPSEAK